MPSVPEKHRALPKKMMLHRRSLSRTTVTVLGMLVMTAVLCQGATGEVLIKPRNQTVLVREKAVFFCQVQGVQGEIRLNGTTISENPMGRPPDVDVDFVKLPTQQDELGITNITLTIDASVERNNSKILCTDHLIGIAGGSSAYLIVIGGPNKPEVEYSVNREKKQIDLTIQRPYTSEEHPITRYDIECRETQSQEIIDRPTTISDAETLSQHFIQHTVELPSDISECSTLQCNVTASNDLDKSLPSILNIYLPRQLMEGHTNLSLEQKSLRFTSTSRPEAIFCVKLPVLCAFQRVEYSVVFSSGGGPVLELYREFNYSSGYTSECIEEKVGGSLEEGVEYEVQVFLYAGESGNFSTSKSPFKPVLQLGLHQNEEFFQTPPGKIVAVSVGAVLIAIIVILSGVIIIISYRRSRRFRHVIKDRANTTPMVDNPIYIGDSHGPFYEQVPPLPKRLNSTSSHTNLDSPGQRLPTPNNVTPVSTHPLYRNGGTPGSPTSTTSSNAFSWPYAIARQTSAASFEAIQADVENRMAAAAAVNQTLPSCTPGEDSYMTMQPAAKSVNEQNTQGKPRYAIDIHGNRYIEC